MKKILTVMMVLILATTLFAAGQQSANAGGSVGAKEGLDAYEPIPDKTYTFSWIGYQLAPISDDPEMVRYWEEVFGNVKFEIVDVEYNQWNEVLNLKFAAGEIPSRMKIIGYDNLGAYVKQDLLAEIPDEVFERYAPNIVKHISSVGEEHMRIGKINGVRYAFPDGFSSMGTIRKPSVMRGDWLDNLGLDVPTTLDEFEEIMYAFTRNDPDGNGKDDTYGLSQSGLGCIYGAFGYIPEKNFWQVRDGQLVFSAIQPEMKDALTLLNKWYDDGVLDPEFITGENSGGYWAISHAFANGRIGFTSHANFYHWIAELYEGFQPVGVIAEMLLVDPEAAKQVKHIPVPVGPDGKKGIKQYDFVSSEFTGISVELEEEPDAIGRILEVMDYMNASNFENYITLNNGIEGKHWDYDDNDLPKPLEGYDDNGKTLATIGAHAVMTCFNPMEYSKILNEPRVKWGEEQGYAEDGIINALKGSLPSAAKYKGELDKLVEEAYIQIIAGDKPIDYFDEFVERWLDGGGSVLVEEANAWYDTVK